MAAGWREMVWLSGTEKSFEHAENRYVRMATCWEVVWSNAGQTVQGTILWPWHALGMNGPRAPHPYSRRCPRRYFRLQLGRHSQASPSLKYTRTTPDVPDQPPILWYNEVVLGCIQCC